MITPTLFNLAYLIVAILAVFLTLRLLDKLQGERFKIDQLPIIKSEPLALGIYRAAWVLGVCILAGSMLGV